MVLSISKAAKAAYYFQGCGFASSWSPDQGEWLDGNGLLGVRRHRGSRSLGGGPSVLLHDLDALLSRRSALTGESATFGADVPHSGTDLTFSAPKSVSIVWALCGDEARERIEMAQHAAVNAAVDLLREHAIKERVGKGGRRLMEASAAIAAFMHFRSRPAAHVLPDHLAADFDLTFPDPNLHSHVVVPDLVVSHAPANAVKGAKSERRLKIAYTALYGRWAMALGAWYHAHLAYELAKLGYPIEPAGENGLFQVAGVEPRWISAFSARSSGRPDLAPATLRVGRHSRKKPQQTSADGKSLTKIWVAFASLIGVDLDRLRPTVRSKIGQPVVLSRKQVADVLSTALAEISRNEAVLQEQDLHRGIAVGLVMLRTCARPSAELVDQLKKGVDLVKLNSTESYDLPQWTTRANESDEREVVRLAKQMVKCSLWKNALPLKISGGDPEWTLGQQTAIAAGLSAIQLTVISGPPGVGKTAALAPVVRAFREEYGDASVIGAAESWQAALNLRKLFGIRSYALASLFAQKRRKGANLTQERLIVVDEAGLLSTRRMLHVLELARRTNAKLVLLGDLEQLAPIGAGSGLQLLERVVTPIPLTEVVRQQDAAQRSLAEAIIAVASEDALSKARRPDTTQDPLDVMARGLVDMRSWHSHMTSEAAVNDVVVRFEEAQKKGCTAVILARSHAETHHVTRVVRQRMRADGSLKDEKDRLIRAVTPMGQTYQLRLAEGDRIRFQMRNDDLGVVNGTTATVLSIDGEGNNPSITAKVDQYARTGQCDHEITFRPSLFANDAGLVRLAPAYAMTIYGAQGVTVDEAIILRSNRMTFRELYVAATRARARFAFVDVKPSRASLEGSDRDDRFARNLFCELRTARSRDRRKALAIEHLEPSLTRHNEANTEWQWQMMTADTVTLDARFVRPHSRS